MSKSELSDAHAALLTHTRRFSLLCERLGMWAKGWSYSVGLVVAVIPGASEALAGDMAAFVNLLEEAQEAVVELARDYILLGQTMATREDGPLSQTGTGHPSE